MINIDDISEIRDELQHILKPKRYEHTLGVAYTSACLAFLYNTDPLRAELAGVLHDCAKCYTHEEMIMLCQRDGVPLTREELDAPQVIHAKYGRYLAEHHYGVTDADVLNAIEFHTTGRACMSNLEKIVFTADYIEPLRKNAPNLPEMRKLAFRDLDECVFRILAQTVDYLGTGGSSIVPATFQAFEFYKQMRLY